MKIELPSITPGDWHLNHGNPSRIVSDQLEFVASVYNPADDGMERETEQNDARAISALPDLLSALADCARRLSLRDGDADKACVLIAQAALEKSGCKITD